MHQYEGMVKENTKDRIMDEAQILVQLRGHNGYSYRDLSKTLGIATSAIHYHFQSKDDLGSALIERYRKRVETRLAEVAVRSSELKQRMREVASIFEAIASDNQKICVCSALGSEYHSLPEAMKAELNRLVDCIEGWIHRFFAEAKAKGELTADHNPESAAALWHSALQGALVITRVTDASHLKNTISELMRTLE